MARLSSQIGRGSFMVVTSVVTALSVLLAACSPAAPAAQGGGAAVKKIGEGILKSITGRCSKISTNPALHVPQQDTKAGVKPGPDWHA